MSIYIARGDDTLGPYTALEAAELVRHGELRPDDDAARDGDAEWTPLASFLPGAAGNVSEGLPRPKPRRVRTVALVVLLLGALAVALPRWKQPPATVERPRPMLRSEMPVPLVIVPDTAKPSVEAKPSGPAPAGPPELPVSARLTGTVLPAGTAAVRVSAYPLATLESYLALKRAEMQAELDRLAPLIAAAAAEKTARVDDERRTLQAVLDAPPDDEMASSLVFAHDQAKAAVATAERNCRYLDDQHREALDAATFFQDLPPPVATAETDPEGAFTLELPAGGPFAVAAIAPETTPGGPRPRRWLVKVPSVEAGRGPLLLSDANAATAGADGSLIR